jgi:hypothetical protein
MRHRSPFRAHSQADSFVRKPAGTLKACIFAIGATQ